MKNFKFKLGGKDYETSVEEKDGNIVEVTVNGKAYSVELEQQAVKPAAHPVARPTAAPSAAPAPAGGASKISAPLPGNITKIIAQAGQSVKKGDVLLTMEAMKMENNITAEFDCKVLKVVAQVGQSVNQGDVLVEVEGAAAPATPAPKPVEAPKAAPTPAPAAPKATPATGAGKKVESPLPGTITKILVSVGQQVNPGDVLLTMEAMKMENNITSEYAGTVKAILVQQGASVMNGDALVEIG